ncbi:nitrate transporter [Thalassobaculum fulvum]|uniref:Nitrate transporter n=1 Tax=Thalassobaculum fulvum TaxID=1633335 RepID=A0A918XYD4_9PROT|nr:CmpA/NrtA family ABC transporter substrate-binding protein [Thalassobaculum fulvum]GHD62445.1 nitrate transporter [Thalassobaculum fulvum]
MSTRVRIGFIPLVDCAPLVALHELGFAREEGLEIVLSRETSWSNVRDKLAVRLYDASHLLAPMALATNLGLGGPRADIVAPYVLNLNGDVICASVQLLDRMAGDGLDAGLSGAEAMLEAIRRNALDRPAVIGVPFFFSTHHYLVRYWLASAGIDPDRQVRVEVIPPSLMAEAVRSGVIDGFCVGEPWGSVAVDAGLAAITLPGQAVWAAAPEKVLGLRRDWVEERRDDLHRLLRALYRASVWVADPGNRTILSELLAGERYVDAPAEVIERALSGSLTLTPRGAQARIDRFMVFHTASATFPWRSQALWFYEQMVRWGHLSATPEAAAIARETFAPGLYREALCAVATDLPGANSKLEGALDSPTPAASRRGKLFLGPDRFCDSAVFDPDKVA